MAKITEVVEVETPFQRQLRYSASKRFLEAYYKALNKEFERLNGGPLEPPPS